MVVCGLDDGLYYARHNGTAWSAWQWADLAKWRVDSHVALAPCGNRLWCVATGKDQRIYTSINGGGVWVNEGIASPNWRAAHAPALAANTAANTLAILLSGADSSLWAGECNGSWQGATGSPGPRPRKHPPPRTSTTSST